MARLARTDLVVAAVIACVALLVSFVGPESPPFRAIVGGPLIFVLPGYSLAMALFPSWSYGRAMLLLISLGLSLAIVALAGLVLNLTPAGVDGHSWAVFLCGLTIVCCLVALLRRRTSLASETGSERILVLPSQLAMFGLAAMLVGVSLWLARAPAPQAPDQAYSVLWAVPVSDANNIVRVGVNSAERATSDYIVRVLDANQELQEFTIQLAPAGVWETDLSLPEVNDDTIEIQLSKAEAPDVVYRRVAVHVGG